MRAYILNVDEFWKLSNDKDWRKMKRRTNSTFSYGTMILVSVALAYFVALEQLFLTLFVGVNHSRPLPKVLPPELIIDYLHHAHSA